MSTEKRVIRLDREGPADTGLSRMEIDPADFQSPLPEQFVHVYFEDPDLGLTVGVWTTTDMQEAFGPYPGDEFMHVLEGNVAMIDGDGHVTPVSEGQTFFIRNAIPISWKQIGFLRKFFITYAAPDAPTPHIDTAAGGVLVLERTKLEPGLSRMGTSDPFVLKNGEPIQRDNILVTNDTGNMFIGMWDSTAFESEMRPFPCHEFVQLLEGEVTITEADGTENRFTAGDCYFVPMGTVCSWKVDGYIKKYYAIIDPSAEA